MYSYLRTGGFNMKKKLVVLMLSAAMTATLLTGCGDTKETTSESTATETEAEATEEAADDSASDQEAADKVAALIDQIYVQERNDNTDEQCKEAKEAWDALTDAQKELVEGENADPDYFGRDTGDASKDDPLNGDDIGDNELLVVSFGTSFNDSRTADIGGIEKALQTAYPDWSVRRAFTAQIIINHVQARDDEKIDNMDQALQRAVDNGVKNLVVQPTHLMHGAEYDELTEAVESYKDKFESVTIADMIRFLLVCITVIGFLILSIPILIVEWIIGKFNPYKKDISSLHLIQSVFRFILWLTGVEVTVIGEELVPTDEAVLYIGNHRSFFDILLTYTRCPRLTGYIAKAEMEKIPLLSNWMHYLHCLFLDSGRFLHFPRQMPAEQPAEQQEQFLSCLSDVSFND